MFNTSKSIWNWLSAITSGILLYLAFPPVEFSYVAWFAWLPLLMRLHQQSSGASFRMGFLSGFVFWMFSLYWVTKVTVIGWIALSAYCALYTGLFVLFVKGWLRLRGVTQWLSNLCFILTGAAVWMGLEYIRSTLLTGFPWHALGYSQYQSLPLIQIAEWGGVYAVSGIVMMANLALMVTVIRYMTYRGAKVTRFHPEFVMVCVLVMMVWFYGVSAIKRSSTEQTTPVQVTLVQTAIPQPDKWSIEKIELIYRRLTELTEAVLHLDAELIIWPETAFPDDVRHSTRSYEVIYNLVTNGVPILAGSMDTQWLEDGTPRYYNSTFLFDDTGALVNGYDKQHLVLFGEYIPLDDYIPFIGALTPIEASFSAGTTSTVFQLKGSAVPFSTLICFEDTIAYLARKAVRNGARWLINQTNDAWFDPTSESKQHMIQCVFRCVENRVPAVRCANTGVSCFIDHCGRVYKVLQDESGEVRVPGFMTGTVNVPGEDMTLTFYTRYGDVIGKACAGLAIVGIGVMMIVGRRMNKLADIA